PRHIIVRIPVLGHPQVAMDILLDNRGKLMQKLKVGEFPLHTHLCGLAVSSGRDPDVNACNHIAGARIPRVA
ncbi:hypothetical protein BST43_13960, partial [Mycobacteroides saopaulense]